ncbi:MAG: fatty acid desaturase [Planctomycetes bacterium]|nr:fatty acid desaturase [Planctomycetota bacterium]
MSNDPHSRATTTDRDPAALKALVAPFQVPSTWRASWQVANTLVPYVALWWAMYHAVAISWWLALPLAVVAGLLLVRAFILFHDCSHGSFFRSRTANVLWGHALGLLAFTPFFHWRGEHAIHHGAAGDLDRRGIGDVWTMTVAEYRAAGGWKKLGYRLVRQPVLLLTVAPLVLFIGLERYSRKTAGRRERLSVRWTNLALLLMAAGMCAVFGIVNWLLLQLVVLGVAGAGGVALFYLQHQHEHAYWERRPEWNYVDAALGGSSFLKLPRVLQWFSGNIGYHHVHHLAPRVPNYYLERCHRSHRVFTEIRPLSVRAALRAFRLALWDEDSKQLVSA